MTKIEKCPHCGRRRGCYCAEITERERELMLSIRRAAMHRPTNADLARDAERRRPAVAGADPRTSCFGKRGYDTRVDAEKIAAVALTERNTILRIYPCTICLKFHLTKSTATPYPEN